MPREYVDKGGTRVLPDTAIEEIHRLKQAFPRLNATQVYRQLVETGNDTSYNFQKVFKATVVTYGIPMKLYVDNGSTSHPQDGQGRKLPHQTKQSPHH